MHMQYYSGQEVCITCNNWKGRRIFDDGQFICSLRDEADRCVILGGASDPEATCREWSLWERISRHPHPLAPV